MEKKWKNLWKKRNFFEKKKEKKAPLLCISNFFWSAALFSLSLSSLFFFVILNFTIFFTFHFHCCFSYFFRTRVTLELLTPTSLPERKPKIYSSNRNSMILKCWLCGLNPSSDRLNRVWKKGKKSTFERNLNVALTPWSTSFRVKTGHSLRVFLSTLRTGENSEWDRWLSWSKRRNSPKAVDVLEKIVEDKSGMALNRRRSKWLIFRLFLPPPYTAYPSKLSYNSQKWG